MFTSAVRWRHVPRYCCLELPWLSLSELNTLTNKLNNKNVTRTPSFMPHEWTCLEKCISALMLLFAFEESLQ